MRRGEERRRRVIEDNWGKSVELHRKTEENRHERLQARRRKDIRTRK